MSEYKIIKFTQLTPLHVGTGKEDYDSSAGMLQSDTLSAALAAIRSQMGMHTHYSATQDTTKHRRIIAEQRKTIWHNAAH